MVVVLVGVHVFTPIPSHPSKQALHSSPWMIASGLIVSFPGHYHNEHIQQCGSFSS